VCEPRRRVGPGGEAGGEPRGGEGAGEGWGAPGVEKEPGKAGEPRWALSERPAPGAQAPRFSLRTERDASNWSTERLKALLLPVRVEGEEGACEVTEVSRLDGEASINNRKGKLIFFYEWAIKLAWTGEWCSPLLFQGQIRVED